MGNVQQKGREDSLSQFQRRKLKYDFYTFFGKLIYTVRPRFLMSTHFNRVYQDSD